MATPPDFTTGQVLTAAQMNAVGMWKITGATVTSAGGTAATATDGVVTVGANNTSVTINSAFNADFKNYRIVISGIVGSTTGNLRFALGTSVTGSAYFGSQYFDLYTGAGTGTNRFNNATTINCGDIVTTEEMSAAFDICKPQLAQRTSMHGQSFGNGYASWFGGTQASTTVFTAITFSPTSGNMTGGTIAIYGYNQ
jgi:hypothetical protein